MAYTLTNPYIPRGSDLLSTFVEGMKENAQAFAKAYPVGSIWISVDKTSPQNIIGGQWTAIGEGRVLVTVGVDNFYWDGDTKVEQKDNGKSGQTGGTKRHTHLNSMGFDGGQAYFRLNDGNPYYNSAMQNNATCITLPIEIQKGSEKEVHGYYVTGRQVRLAYTRENSNYPPYFTVYMWRRTA